MAELLGMLEGNPTPPEQRRPLFPGRSCFPLTADSPQSYQVCIYMYMYIYIYIHECVSIPPWARETLFST